MHINWQAILTNSCGGSATMAFANIIPDIASQYPVYQYFHISNYYHNHVRFILVCNSFHLSIHLINFILSQPPSLYIRMQQFSLINTSDQLHIHLTYQYITFSSAFDHSTFNHLSSTTVTLYLAPPTEFRTL